MNAISAVSTIGSGLATSLNDATSHGILYFAFDGFFQIAGQFAGGAFGVTACAPVPIAEAVCGAAASYEGGQEGRNLFKAWFG
jgi:putative methionine-R-sulfoxide reductase with GAF domain